MSNFEDEIATSLLTSRSASKESSDSVVTFRLFREYLQLVVVTYLKSYNIASLNSH